MRGRHCLDDAGGNLIHELRVDWRRGADYFESLLVDYDVASNWGNWVAAAGLTGACVKGIQLFWVLPSTLKNTGG